MGTANDYEMVCGLEVHCQLRTETKLFCGCRYEFGAPPNSRVCPVCLGHPGVLPVLNRKAFDYALRAALALNCEIAAYTKFDRKHYYYPDLPKNYQITQYDLPYSRNGWLDIEVRSANVEVRTANSEGRGAKGEGGPGDRGPQTKRIGLTRIHMEEDAGKLLHPEQGEPWSLVDLNRAGVPLMEIVSEPDVRSPEEAHAYLTALKQRLIDVGVSACDMEKGELRCDANVSLRPRGETTFGTRVEIKNLNSFKFVAQAIAYEVKRQAQVLASGGRIAQETRLWNTEREMTVVMRTKEEAQDYRYFPEPDLPPFVVDDAWRERIRKEIPELSGTRQERFQKEYGLSAYDAGVLTGERTYLEIFEKGLAVQPDAKALANWVTNDLPMIARDAGLDLAADAVRARAVAAVPKISRLVTAGTVNRATGREILAEALKTGKDPDALVKEKGAAQVSDAGQLDGWADQAIAASEKAVADYKSGKEASLQFIVGQMMKLSKGKANPQVVRELLKKKLE